MKYIYLSGVVDPFWGEISQKTVDEAVTAARADDSAEEITVVINSPGGDVAEGINIYNYLRRAKVNTEISGVAASIASVIALAGKHVAIYDNSTMFIHHAWCYLGDGNADDARTAADRMDAIDGTLANIYASRGLDQDQITELMDGPDGQGSMLTAARALELGLVDEVLDPAKAVAACLASFRSHPHHTHHPTQEVPHMAEKKPAKNLEDPQAACGDPDKNNAAAAATGPVQNEDGDTDKDTRIAELESKVAELEKKLSDTGSNSQQAAQLKASVRQAYTQTAAKQNQEKLEWPECIKKAGSFARACELYPEERQAYIDSELAKGSIR